MISTAVFIWTSLGWIAGLRTGMRGIFDLPPLKTNIVLVKLKDLGTLLILAVALIVTSALAVVANTALGLVVDWLQFEGAAAVPLTRDRRHPDHAAAGHGGGSGPVPHGVGHSDAAPDHAAVRPDRRRGQYRAQVLLLAPLGQCRQQPAAGALRRRAWPVRVVLPAQPALHGRHRLGSDWQSGRGGQACAGGRPGQPVAAAAGVAPAPAARERDASERRRAAA